MLILSPQGRQQNLSLGTNPIVNAEPCFPHENIVCSHLCDVCLGSNRPDDQTVHPGADLHRVQSDSSQ